MGLVTRRCERAVGEVGVGRGEAWVGLRVWAGVLGSFSISFSFLFLIQTKFEFKYNFEFKPHSNKSMHQHECNTEFLKLRQILITCETKIKLYAILTQ